MQYPSHRTGGSSRGPGPPTWQPVERSPAVSCPARMPSPPSPATTALSTSGTCRRPVAQSAATDGLRDPSTDEPSQELASSDQNRPSTSTCGRDPADICGQGTRPGPPECRLRLLGCQCCLAMNPGERATPSTSTFQAPAAGLEPATVGLEVVPTVVAGGAAWSSADAFSQVRAILSVHWAPGGTGRNRAVRGLCMGQMYGTHRRCRGWQAVRLTPSGVA